MDSPAYFYPFIISFLISAGLSGILIWLSKKIRLISESRKSIRHAGKKIRIPRMGGMAIIIAFCLALILDPELVISQPLWGIMTASFIILAFGLWDDFFEIDWKTQLFFQFVIAALIFIIGVRVEYVTNPLGGVFFLLSDNFFLPSLFFGILWIVLLMNTVNWIDGLDGLSGGVVFLGSLAIFFLSLKPEVNQPPIGIISMALAGAVLGFLIFNFYPARILAGTSGSMFMGFMLAVLSIFAGAKIATALLVMAVPIIDAIWVIGERIRSGNSVFKADRRHLHFKLLELGWSEKKISIFFYSITLIILMISLNTRTIGKTISIVLVFLIMVAYIIFVNNRLSHKNLHALKH